MARSERKKTIHVGVYERKITNRLGKTDYAYDITYKDGNRKIWECVGQRSAGVTAGLAARERGKRIEGQEQGFNVAPGAIPTFEQAWNLYLENHLRGKRNAKTDQQIYANHLEAQLGAKPLNKITPLDIQRLMKELENTPKAPPRTERKEVLQRYAENPKKLSPQTIKHILALVRRIYNKCRAWGLYNGKMPLEGIKPPKVDNRRERFLTKEEAGALLGYLQERSPQWHDIALLSLHTGMRREEIFNLKAHQLDFESGIIYVMDAKAGTRTAYMTGQVKGMLARRAANDLHPDDYIFKNASGGRINNVSSVFTRAAEKLFNEGVTDDRHKVVFHTLRHTFASWLAQAGEPIYTIAELMGHSVLEMTKRYAKLSPDTKRRAVEVIDRMAKS